MAKDLTVGKPFKVILTFALPMIIANIFQQLYNIVDTAVVGQLCGSAELAGVGSTASMVFLIVQGRYIKRESPYELSLICCIQL